MESVVHVISKAGVIITDPSLRVVHIEGAIFEDRGLEPEHWRGQRISDVLPAEAVANLGPRYRAAAAGEPQSFDYWTLDRRHAYWVQIAPVRDECGAITSVVAVMQEITNRLRVTAELARSEARLRESEQLVGVGSWEILVDTTAISYSEGFGRLLGLTPGAALDVDGYLALVHEDDRERVLDSITRCLDTGSATAEYRLLLDDGQERTVSVHGDLVSDSDGPRYLRGAILDVTEQRAGERERLAAVSLFEQAFDAAPIGMVLTHVGDGRYIRVNDAMCRLLWRSREELLGLRIDEVTHDDDSSRDDEARRAMLDGGLEHYETEKRYLRPDGSVVWAALHAAPVRNPDGSVRAFFSQIIDITERKAREGKLEHDVNDAIWLGRIRDALDQDRLVIYSQPIIDLTTGRTVQQELLLRMVADDGTIVAPGDFLPIAERYGLISEIDRWVIRQATQNAATGVPTEFNVSGASIGDPDVLREIESALESTGADPSLLTIEVTETAVMNEIEAGRVFAQRVTDLGCSIALDDFGMGWASLTYLKHFPTQHLKIDIEFVQDLTTSDADERLVRGIVGLAKEFDLVTTAEGIEDNETLIRLRELGVDRGQGYLFGRPQPLLSALPPAPLPNGASPSVHCPEGGIDVVRSVFEAFADRDADAALTFFDPDAVMRVLATSQRADGEDAYRGHRGIRRYFEDVSEVWDDLVIEPGIFREAANAVIVFGTVRATLGTTTLSADVLWVCRVRAGLVTSIEVFQAAQEPTRTSADNLLAAKR
jgi:PAS domain S-box-containing protein